MDKETCSRCFQSCVPKVRWLCPIVDVRIEFLAGCPMDEPGGPVELNREIVIFKPKGGE